MSAAIVINEEEALTFPKFATSEDANAAHRRIAGCLRDALGIGEFLTRQKEELGHGNYLPWFDKNMEFGRTTGTKYVKLWDNRHKFSPDENLDLTEAYRIAGILKEPKSKEPVVDATFQVVPAETERKDPYAIEPLSLERGLDGQMFSVSGSDRKPKYALLRDGAEEPKSWTAPRSPEIDEPAGDNDAEMDWDAEADRLYSDVELAISQLLPRFIDRVNQFPEDQRSGIEDQIVRIAVLEAYCDSFRNVPGKQYITKSGEHRPLPRWPSAKESKGIVEVIDAPTN